MPLRRDAQRNRERLIAAAAEVFRERGLEVPLEEIAQRAGVSAGTLYNRFGGRDALIDAVVPALVGARAAQTLERASAIAGPWEAFACYVTLICEQQADDRALNDAVSRRFPDAAELTAICDAQLDSAGALVERAQAAGELRADFRAEDLGYLFWSTSMIVQATHGIAPGSWRRAVGIILDGLRAGAASPLPEPALTREQLHAAMLGLSQRKP